MGGSTHASAQEIYLQNQIMTASKEKLLLLTYDIGIRSCAVAEEAISKKDRESANAHLQRAQRVIRELMVALNVEVDEKLAKGLLSLYSFMYEQLVEANVYLDSNKVKIVRGMLEELRLSWEKAIETLRKDKGEVREVASPKMRQISTGGLDIAG